MEQIEIMVIQEVHMMEIVSTMTEVTVEKQFDSCIF